MLEGKAAIVTGASRGVGRAAVDMAQDRFGRLDVLATNAGINTRGATLEMPLADWRRVLEVNLTGTPHFYRTALPVIVGQGGGKIVNVSSTTAKSASRNAASAYRASKAAVEYLTRRLALEMAPHGILVNAVSPVPVDTDMSAQWSEEYRRQVTGRIPVGRLGTPRQIAGIMLFPCLADVGFCHRRDHQRERRHLHELTGAGATPGSGQRQLPKKYM